ncbi:unnamed protein product [Echinostoma caproni]|uniref:ANK_REP_REGION domain-containing protein n=1 Tax=Echinostoma caproni TaxID=27848 RepID=A0A183A0I6_9TREM|nr:unnamed protein product [Echinostoma caproni]
MARDIKKMYDHGDDLEQLDSQGAAPIHIAAGCGYQEVLTMLLRMGVNPDLLDADSWTPSHVAVCWGQVSEKFNSASQPNVILTQCCHSKAIWFLDYL